jgi:glycosyltransferase involved in cell wall biosynthesis
MPVHNVENYIEEALKSVVAQTFCDFELICMDDASDDRTSEVLLTWAKQDERIKIITNATNQGPGICRNVALNQALGKYVACIDSDDTMDGTYLEKAFKKLEETGVDSVWVKPRVYWEKDGTVGPMHFFPELPKLREGYLEIGPHNIYKYPAYSWYKIMTKQSVVNTGAKWSEGLLFEDIEFYWRHYTQASRVYVIDEELYTYRRRIASITNKFASEYRFEDIYSVMVNIFNFLNEKALFGRYKSSFLYSVAQSINEFKRHPEVKERLNVAILKLLEDIDFPQAYKDCPKIFEG